MLLRAKVIWAARDTNHLTRGFLSREDSARAATPKPTVELRSPSPSPKILEPSLRMNVDFLFLAPNLKKTSPIRLSELFYNTKKIIDVHRKTSDENRNLNWASSSPGAEVFLSLSTLEIF